MNGLLERLEREPDAVFAEVCARGYQALGRSLVEHPRIRENPWQVRAAYPPSYEAQGRYRFLTTLREARRLGGSRVLEVAAGGGFNAACLWEPGREVWVNDLRPLSQELEAYTTGAHLRCVEADLFGLDPATMGTFDLVIAAEVAEHVAHGDRLARHLRGLVRPGGALLLTTPNGAHVRSRLPTHSQISDFDALEAGQFRPDADGHLYLYTAAELCAVLRSAGFEQLEVRFSITPFLSGHAGARRVLPARRALLPHYLRLDRLLRSLRPLERALSTQLLVVAR